MFCCDSKVLDTVMYSRATMATKAHWKAGPYIPRRLIIRDDGDFQTPRWPLRNRARPQRRRRHRRPPKKGRRSVRRRLPFGAEKRDPGCARQKKGGSKTSGVRVSAKRKPAFASDPLQEAPTIDPAHRQNPEGEEEEKNCSMPTIRIIELNRIRQVDDESEQKRPIHFSVCCTSTTRSATRT